MNTKKEIQIAFVLTPLIFYVIVAYGNLKLHSAQTNVMQTSSTKKISSNSTNLKNINTTNSNHVFSLSNKKYPFYIYSDYGAPFKMHFFPSGYMGDVFSLNLVGNHRTNQYSGKSCIRIKYTPNDKTNVRNSWAGIYWLHPPNNWAIVPKIGYDLSDAKEFIFHAKGTSGKEIITFIVGGVEGKYPDSGRSKPLTVKLTKKWQKYKISLKGIKMSHIIGGFAFVIKEKINTRGAVFYLDEMYYSNQIIKKDKK